MIVGLTDWKIVFREVENIRAVLINRDAFLSPSLLFVAVEACRNLFATWTIPTTIAKIGLSSLKQLCLHVQHRVFLLFSHGVQCVSVF
jgi:hypothetical protein